MSDPAYSAWTKADKRLKRQGVPKSKRPAPPPDNPAYPSKQTLALRGRVRFAGHLDFPFYRSCTGFSVGLCLLMPIVVFLVDACILLKPWLVTRLWQAQFVRSSAYVACLYAMIMFGVFDGAEFIYFQF